MPVLQFKGKTAVENYHYTIPHHLLEFDPKLSVLEKGQKPSLDGNLIIEGDNLLALKALLPTHGGRVKCIYIDPPYNTGNEGWVYNDNLTQPQFKEWIGQTVGKEGEDFCRHDKWCCMMYPRLMLLRELLRDDGSIWVSIDDNEIHALRMVMDEVFGRENFISTVIWQKIYSPRSSAKYLSENHDYVVAYAKRLESWHRNLLPRTAEQNERYSNPDNDPRGPWKPSDLSARNYYSKGTFSIKCPSGRVIEKAPGGRYWRCSEENFKKLVKDNRIWWGPSGNNVPAIKRFLSEVKKGIVPQTIWTYKEVGHTQDAKKEILDIFDGRMVFMTPKPVALMKRILEIATDAKDIVLDSFAGSGTTGHAALRLNAENDGSRRFVLVQMSYDTAPNSKSRVNVARDVTAPRIQRVIEGYAVNGEKKKRVPGLGGSFTYCRLGRPLLNEHRNFGKELPAYDELARYIFYTETSQEFDPKALERKTGRIGEDRGTAYFLLYSADAKKDWALDAEWLKDVAAKEKCKKVVVYCEKLWAHREDLAKWEKKHGKTLRPMIVPVNLK